MEMKLPEKTVERLSLYRCLLLRYKYLEKPFIFSKDLARMLRVNPVHIRRDLMLLGFSGSHSKGYDVQNLIDSITNKLECRAGKTGCIIGYSHTGRAAMEIFAEDFTPIRILAIFDTSAKSINKDHFGVPCYSIDRITKIIEENKITLAILTEAFEDLDTIKDLLIACGIKGIMNLTHVKLDLPEHIHLEEFDMRTSLIKLAYFTED